MSMFRPRCQDIEFYKKMVAFVMAYSFTDEQGGKSEKEDEEDGEEEGAPAPPMMVPMADILNHVSKNNAQMFFDTHSLKMKAKTAIKKVGIFYFTSDIAESTEIIE